MWSWCGSLGWQSGVMEDLWPLFGLRLVSGSVVLRLPREHEIAELARVAATGVHQATERPFLTPWAEGSPEERSRFVLREHWTSLGSWTIDRWQLGLGVFVDDQPVGIVAIRAQDFPVVREVTSSSWLGLAHQGRGFGTDARRGVLALSFEYLDADAALTEVFQDNHASQGVSRKLGDNKTLAAILAAESSGAAKALGRRVLGFDEQRWSDERVEIVARGSVAKFGSSPELRNYLVGSVGRVLVEASPTDLIWGLGLAADDEAAMVPSRWPGQNLLGLALKRARSQLAAA